MQKLEGRVQNLSRKSGMLELLAFARLAVILDESNYN